MLETSILNQVLVVFGCMAGRIFSKFGSYAKEILSKTSRESYLGHPVCSHGSDVTTGSKSENH